MKSLTSLPDISKWDLHSISDMENMFEYCENLTSIPDISKWDIHSVKAVREMFCGLKN